MEDLSIELLLWLLLFLVLLSGFFSASETAMMSINRYKLRHLVKAKHAGAIRTNDLLNRIDRLIGLILLGNNFVNILAASITTIITLKLLDETWIAISAGLLTLVILIFAEVTPKTMAAIHPERIAFPASVILKPLLVLSYPLVWGVNLVANTILRLFRVSPEYNPTDHLSSEELRTVVKEAGTLIPLRHQKMLVNILDLEKVAVEDIMIPRNEIHGINLSNDIDDIGKQIVSTQHTRLIIYRESIDNIIGTIHLRRTLPLILNEELSTELLTKHAKQPYFIPEGTPLNVQLLNFQRLKRRIGLVVDEYGDIQGLVTLEDILEEIVGEFTTNTIPTQDVYPQEDGTFLVDGSVTIRDLNKSIACDLPTNGPKTINGLITEHLETLPRSGTSILIASHPIDIIQTTDSGIKTVRLHPAISKKLNN